MYVKNIEKNLQRQIPKKHDKYSLKNRDNF